MGIVHLLFSSSDQYHTGSTALLIPAQWLLEAISSANRSECCYISVKGAELRLFFGSQAIFVFLIRHSFRIRRETGSRISVWGALSRCFCSPTMRQNHC